MGRWLGGAIRSLQDSVNATLETLGHRHPFSPCQVQPHETAVGFICWSLRAFWLTRSYPLLPGVSTHRWLLEAVSWGHRSSVDRCETKSRVERIRSYGDESTPTERARISYTRGFQMKRGRVECGGGGGEWSALAFVSVVFTTFHTLVSLHAPQVRASAAAEQARSYVWNVSVKHSPERSTERTAPHRWCPQLSCWESVQAPRRKASPQLLVAERLCEGKMLSQREKKKSTFYMIKASI